MLDLSHVFAAFPTLESERCILREITMDDVDALYDIRSDDLVSKYLGDPPMRHRDQAVASVEATMQSFQSGDGSLKWGVAMHDNNRLIGTVSVWHIRKQHYRAELGYMLARDYWGKGIIPEVCTTVLDYAFGTMNLHSMDANIDPRNDASRRVLEKLGFVQEAYFREDYFDPMTETFTDSAIFSMLASTWQQRRNAG